MKLIRRILSFALILVMLATCAIQHVFVASAATETIVNITDNPEKTITSETMGKNLRFIGGTYGYVFAGGFNANYTTSEDIIYTFDAGTFNNVNVFGRNPCTLSGNVIFNINGGTFNYVHDYNADLDYTVDGKQQPEHAIMFGDIRGVRVNAGDGYPREANVAGSQSMNNVAIIIDGGSDTLVLSAVDDLGRTPTHIGIWMAIVNNCTDATVPTLSGNAGNQTTLTNSTDDKFIDITNFDHGDYRMYVKGGVATPVFDGTTFLGFQLKSNTAGMIPKISYTYKDGNFTRKGVAYPTADESGVYDLSAYQLERVQDSVMIVEFVNEVEALGASLRFKTDDTIRNGIRFGVKFSKNFVTGAGTDSANFGLILMAKSTYESKSWTLAELKASSSARVAYGSTCIEDPVAQTYTVNAVLYNIATSDYQKEIVAIPFIGDILYTEKASTRSIYSVAQACVNDDTASAEAKAYCQGILDSLK